MQSEVKGGCTLFEMESEGFEFVVVEETERHDFPVLLGNVSAVLVNHPEELSSVLLE